MNLFFWKTNKLIDNFAKKIADEFYSRVQPALAEKYFSDKIKDKRKKKEIERFVQGLIKEVGNFREEHSLGVYGKARLQLKFSNHLQELGYKPELANQLNSIVLWQA